MKIIWLVTSLLRQQIIESQMRWGNNQIFNKQRQLKENSTNELIVSSHTYEVKASEKQDNSYLNENTNKAKASEKQNNSLTKINDISV